MKCYNAIVISFIHYYRKEGHPDRVMHRKMSNTEIKAPWLEHYGVVPKTLEYSKTSLYGSVLDTAKKYPKNGCYSFFGTITDYRQAIKRICICADALTKQGIKSGDRVTVCLPNCPQAVIMVYALNKIGAIASMIHPLSADKEIEFYVNESQSIAAITLEKTYEAFSRVLTTSDSLKLLILTGIEDEFPFFKKIGYCYKIGKNEKHVELHDDYLSWNDLMKQGHKGNPDNYVHSAPEDPAVILYSGGTTGTNKGIVHSNLSINAEGSQIIATNPAFASGDSMLAVLPVFHGFGLAVGIHSMLANGGMSILIPQFTPKSFAGFIIKYRPNFLIGVPTLYESLLKLKDVEGLDFSFIKGIYSGGDSLPVELKKRFDSFLIEHHSNAIIREGYGATECVAATCLTPYNEYREGSIGIPFPDTFYKIVEPGTCNEVPYGTDGEICICGPTVMLHYLNNELETANTLRVHTDGHTWLHTGDMGMMDDEGFVYFRQRIKRMIISNGYNVYPTQVEEVLNRHEAVHMCCVIGVNDSMKMEKIKAFVVLREGFEADTAMKRSLTEHMKQFLAKYAIPREIEFRSELPKTKVGKIAYRELEAEELKRITEKKRH